MSPKNGVERPWPGGCSGDRRDADTIVVGSVTIQVTSVVVPEISAELLLANPRTACFAPGAHTGDWSHDDLCRRAAAVLKAGNATWLELHMAVVAAAMQGRYESMAKVLDEMNMEPIIIEDLVKFGEDRGFEKGIEKGIEEGRLEMAREMLLEMLDLRGISVDDSTRARILTEPSMDRLREWCRRALTESSVKAIVRD
jgi:hypothetical protein